MPARVNWSAQLLTAIACMHGFRYKSSMREGIIHLKKVQRARSSYERGCGKVWPSSLCLVSKICMQLCAWAFCDVSLLQSVSATPVHTLNFGLNIFLSEVCKLIENLVTSQANCQYF